METPYIHHTAMQQREQIEQAIAVLETQRTALGGAVVDTLIATARDKLDVLDKAQAVPECKYVTVLFADVCGFVAMADQMAPQEVADIINALWQRLDRAIVVHGGMIDKHVGDGVMALFGVPVAGQDDSLRAVRAALAMQREIAHLRARGLDDRGWQDLSPAGRRCVRSLAIRIGINTGPALLGRVGTMGEYTAMGDTVNVAKRLEQAAPRGGILISHDTYRDTYRDTYPAARGVFAAQAMKPIRVKGKVKPLQTYAVRPGVRERAARKTSMFPPSSRKNRWVIATLLAFTVLLGMSMAVESPLAIAAPALKPLAPVGSLSADPVPVVADIALDPVAESSLPTMPGRAWLCTVGLHGGTPPILIQLRERFATAGWHVINGWVGTGDNVVADDEMTNQSFIRTGADVDRDAKGTCVSAGSIAAERLLPSYDLSPISGAAWARTIHFS